MDKKTFRQQQIQRLSRMTAEERVAQNLSIQQQLFASAAWQRAQVVAITISSGIEVDTRPLVKRAWADGKTVVIPKTLPHRQMAFYPYTDASQLVRTKFGILEPTSGTPVEKKQIDLILVPGLGYARQEMARIGFGGGYYDRYLADYAGVKLTVAYTQMAFEHAEWPVAKYDVLLDQLIVAKDGSHEDN
ncbi:5-formyltetrahydrofolate cyclo-ligase [Lactiplantibacillus garii]|uniref:5-formyltetrahydrofolate cyclo-ligase n=1 Tax=Lactiplantibacillus garii TaxID=2306423 RepID=A0A426D4I1_9LACO|nr:5-formyltetrahydrofolate cyclo-ligase [Lactiplantibacillus garii]RRK09516.1 5-formyltetrahydrofolate cyclo-ligase [Lactiplantibacillus garii]